jgi:hypothetical protein
MEIIKKIKNRIKKWNAYWAKIEEIRMKCMIKSGRGFWIVLILLASCGTTDKVEPKKCCEKETLYNKYKYLDNDTNIVHWEIWEDSLLIYTKEDSIRDERERWRYIDSLHRAEDMEELFYNNPDDTTYIRMMEMEYGR